MSRPKPAIRLRGVTKQFGSFIAASDITFTVPSGQIVGFVGANGAGKTTTISMLLGFISATEGVVEIFGRPMQPSNAHASHQAIGYASGDMELPGQLTGAQYLAFVRAQRGNVSDEQLDAVVSSLKPQLDKKIHTLSRGNKQKIALAAAFLGGPDLIVLDEPTSGLDPVMQDVFLDMVRAHKQAGKTVFMSSHYLQEVMDVCDRVMLMSHGTVVEDVLTSELQELGGKHIRVATGYKPTKPPKGAESVERTYENGEARLSFVYKGDMGQLQRWIAALKQLNDIEVSEYNLEGAFKSLYESEDTQ